MPPLALAHHGTSLHSLCIGLQAMLLAIRPTIGSQDYGVVCAAAQKGCNTLGSSAHAMDVPLHLTNVYVLLGLTRMRVAPGASSSIRGVGNSAVQVLAIVVAAIVARTHAEQEVDEADLSLAYSGGSGRVSPFSTFWLSASCIRHVRPGEHASKSARRDQHKVEAVWSLHPSLGRTLKWVLVVFPTCPEMEAWPAVLVEVAAVGPRGLRICTQRANLAVIVHEVAHGPHREHSQHADAPRGLPAVCYSSLLPRTGVQALHGSLWEGSLISF